MWLSSLPATSTRLADFNTEIITGQCWENVTDLMPRYKNILSFRYVLDIKDGFVKFEQRQCVEETTGFIRVESIKDFKDRGRLIQTERTPFDETNTEPKL